MKRGCFLVIFVLCCMSLSFAAVDTQNGEFIFDVASLEITSSISSTFDVDYLSSRAELTLMDAELNFFPQDNYRQQVQSLVYTPTPKTQDANEVHFVWENIGAGSYPFAMNSRVTTYNRVAEVKKKIPFPIIGLRQEFQPYLREQPNIDITPEIRKQANAIASGKDDLYIVAHDLAHWIETNIEYSLSTITAEAALPASWVFRERKGVCDELTLLYISMLRSLGIPAKFVSGVAYTDSTLFDEKWNSHAWAEVYFPGYGWVPFDITYQQYGIIDASHVKLREAADGNSSITEYNWAGYDLSKVDIDLHPLAFDTQIIGQSGNFEYPVDYSIELFADEIGFGSFNRVDVTVSNTADHYTVASFGVHSTREVNFETNRTSIALKPFEQKTISFVVSLESNLDTALSYSIPVHVVDAWHEPQVIWMQSDRNKPIYDRSSVLPATRTEQSTSKTDFSVECLSEELVAVNAEFDVECAIENTGNVALVDLVVCVRQDCVKTDVGITQSKTILIPTAIEQQGQHSVSVIATHRNTVVKETVLIEAQDRPVITVQNITAPISVAYGEEFFIEFSLDVLGTANNVQVILDNGYSPLSWQLKKLQADQLLKAELSSTFLDPGVTDIVIQVMYYDLEANAYQEDASLQIEMTDIGFFESFWLRTLHFFEQL